MDRIIKKTNKGNLKSNVIVNLEEEYRYVAMNSENQDVDYEEEPQENNLEIDNVNELEQDLSEVAPIRIRKKRTDVLNLIPKEKIKFVLAYLKDCPVDLHPTK